MLSTTLVGFHGTSADRLPSILANGFKASTRSASWLGFGVYFFYNAPGHASNWATKVTARRHGQGSSVQPVRVEAEIRLGNCLNLLDNIHWPMVRNVYSRIPASVAQLSFYNSNSAAGAGLNYRDCAALNAVVAAYTTVGAPLDTILAAFPEGKPIDPASWLFDEATVAICVLRPAAIQITGHQFV